MKYQRDKGQFQDQIHENHVGPRGVTYEIRYNKDGKHIVTTSSRETTLTS